MNTTAQIILAQLGGDKFLTMTGAKNLVRDDDRGILSMDIPASLVKGRANKLSIWLLGDDTYSVQTLRYSARSLSIAAVATAGCQAATLRETVERLTGLRTSL